MWLQYTFSELLDIVQASELELRQALVDLKACVIHGKYHLSSFTTCYDLLFYVMFVCSFCLLSLYTYILRPSNSSGCFVIDV